MSQFSFKHQKQKELGVGNLSITLKNFSKNILNSTSKNIGLRVNHKRAKHKNNVTNGTIFFKIVSTYF